MFMKGVSPRVEHLKGASFWLTLALLNNSLGWKKIREQPFVICEENELLSKRPNKLTD
jgi:hypothetical protein